MKPIYLAGEGWGNECALRGLRKVFEDVVIIEPDDKETLNHLKGKTVVFAGFKPIIPREVLVDNECINIHYSLLPKYRGLHSTVWAIINDEDYLGLSIHLMTEYIDDGPIIFQYKVQNDRVKTSCEYMELFNKYVEDNLGQIIEDYLLKRIVLIDNNKSDATWVGKRNRKDCKIDFNKNLNYLHCFFRALVEPYPLPYVVYKGEEVKVTKVDYHTVNVETHIGRILNIDNDGLWVKAKDGYLIIKELRDNDNKIVPFERFKIGQYFS